MFLSEVHAHMLPALCSNDTSKHPRWIHADNTTDHREGDAFSLAIARSLNGRFIERSVSQHPNGQSAC